MKNSRRRLFVSAILVVVGGGWPGRVVAAERPTLTPHHEAIAEITCFAEQPEIVTPVGVAVAPDGRVFVQENQTHEREPDYEGPERDRILVFADTDGDGVADERTVFYEGLRDSTDLTFGPDGHLYVATRNTILRFRDAGDRVVAAPPETLIVCETDARYPHNGLGGLAIDAAEPDRLVFGIGENLGRPYTLRGTDGIELGGAGGGGATFRCRTDGGGLTQLSTGHWNPFGLAFGLDGSLFATDNDPDAMPPNRLLHVVVGADFGFEYRYGRSGRSPLICWNGELPGTLPRVAALGEAACGVTHFGPDQLLTASWTENRIDLHALSPAGASFTGRTEPFITGPESFRPVHFAWSADSQTLYVSDWVSRSYPVHGQGRIWRVRLRRPVSLQATRRPGPEPIDAAAAVAMLGQPDPLVRTAAVHYLAAAPDQLRALTLADFKNPTSRAWFAVAIRRAGFPAGEWIPRLLADDAPAVRLVGVKWIADVKAVEFQPQLEHQLTLPNLNTRLLMATHAALSHLSGRDEPSCGPMLMAIALDPSRSATVRAKALQLVPVPGADVSLDRLERLVEEGPPVVADEAMRALWVHPDPDRATVFARVAGNAAVPKNLRADAVAGLAAFPGERASFVESLLADQEETVAAEAARTLAAVGLRKRRVTPKPPPEDVAGWMAVVDSVNTPPDLALGRRLFFHPVLGGCSRCHMLDGRGGRIGPDLTLINQQHDVTADWLMRHIVNPSAAIAPPYRTQLIVGTDGRVFTGLLLEDRDDRLQLLAADGSRKEFSPDDILERHELPVSLMPTGLLDQLTPQEIRGLIELLLSERTVDGYRSLDRRDRPLD